MRLTFFGQIVCETLVKHQLFELVINVKCSLVLKVWDIFEQPCLKALIADSFTGLSASEQHSVFGW